MATFVESLRHADSNPLYDQLMSEFCRQTLFPSFWTLLSPKTNQWCVAEQARLLYAH